MSRPVDLSINALRPSTPFSVLFCFFFFFLAAIGQLGDHVGIQAVRVGSVGIERDEDMEPPCVRQQN